MHLCEGARDEGWEEEEEEDVGEHCVCGWRDQSDSVLVGRPSFSPTLLTFESFGEGSRRRVGLHSLLLLLAFVFSEPPHLRARPFST